MLPLRVFRSTGAVARASAGSVERQVVSENDVAQAPVLARLLNRIMTDLRDASQVLRKPVVEFEDVVIAGGGASVPLAHNLGCRVRWFVVDWVCSTGAAPILRKDTTNTDANRLVLLSSQAGTVSIRVEAT